MTPQTLVVGASGPLGQAIIADLNAHGHEVTAISRSGGEGSIRLDVGDSNGVERVLDEAKPQSVVYLARPDGEGTRDRVAEIGRPIEALRDFAIRCARHGVQRLVFASSAAVYGTHHPQPRRESDRPEGRGFYAQLKLGSEGVLSEVASEEGITLVCLRIFNAYGPGLSGSLVNRLILGATPPPVVYPSATFVRDYIHSSDIARAFRAALLYTAGSITVNVGTGVGTSNLRLVALCPEAVYRKHTDNSIESFSVADTSLLHDLWGFTASIGLEHALAHPAEFF